MSTLTTIPETPMGETEQDSYFESKEKFQQQLQDIFQTTLRLTSPDQFDQLCQWMKYNQYLTIDDFYESSYNDPEKFETEGPATEYKWKGKMNYLSANVAQKLKQNTMEVATTYLLSGSLGSKHGNHQAILLQVIHTHVQSMIRSTTYSTPQDGSF